MNYPDTDDDAAREGNAMHWVAAQSLESGGAIKCGHWVDQPADNGVILTQEFVDVAQTYVDEVFLTIELAGAIGSLIVERPVKIPRIAPDCEGTPDAWCYSALYKTLYVWDFKSGYGVVEAEDNAQLLAYASGILFELYQRGIPQPERVCMYIVQPRPWHALGPIREWTISPAEVETRIDAIKATLQQSYLKSGSHCKYCPLRFDCPALYGTITDIYQSVTNINTLDLEPNQLGAVWTMLDDAESLVKEMKASLDERVLQLQNEGQAVKGLGTTRTRGSTVWNDDAKEKIKSIGDFLGVEVCKEKLITPTQAIKAGLSEKVVKENSTHMPGNIKVKPINNQLAKQVFK